MDAATARENLTPTNEEVKRLCTVFGVQQSNRLYRLLQAADKTEVTARLVEEVQLESRGGEKCGVGQVWDEVRQICV